MSRGASCFSALSDGLGPVQANLMVHGRLGASAAGAAAAGGGTGGAAGLEGRSFLPPQAKVIQRLLGATSATTCVVLGETLMWLSAATWSLLSTLVVADGRGGYIDFLDSEKGAKLVYVVFGGGGLGVLVRDGLVSPPSLVSSAVEGRLALLIIDRRRDRFVGRCSSGFDVSGSGVFSALVSSDSFRSDWLRIIDFWKSAGGCAWRWSGGSSTSAARSSSATSGMLAVAATVCDRQMKRSCKPIMSVRRAAEGVFVGRGAAIGQLQALSRVLGLRARQGCRARRGERWRESTRRGSSTTYEGDLDEMIEGTRGRAADVQRTVPLRNWQQQARERLWVASLGTDML